MKKILLIMASLLLVAACANKEDEFIVDETLYHTGRVSLLASIEDFSTKAEMPATGHGCWKKGDEIAVQVSDGSFVTFSLDGTGDTKRAKFVGDIPEGKTLGGYAVYPASAVKASSLEKVTITVPEVQDYDENTFDGAMLAKIGETWEITFQQLLCYVNLSLSNYPAGGAKFVLKEPGYSLSGDFEIDLATAGESGISLREGDGARTYNLSQSSSKASLVVLLPVGEYSSLNFAVKDKNGKTLTSKNLLAEFSLTAERACIKKVSQELDKVASKVEGAIVLRDVVWIAGCLQRNSSATNAGFQTGWEVAPYQWYTYNYQLKENGKYTYDPTTATQMRFDIDQNHCNHFNFGGIKEPYTKEPSSYANPSGALCISGKMYTDRECTQETRDFNAAVYGDLAYWASKGNYRMPTAEELQTLSECDAQYGYYLTPDNFKVWGVLFTEPATEGTPYFNSVESQITDDMLVDGLFLPLAGRRANSSVTVINYRTQGCYWSGNAVAKSTATGDGVEDKGTDYQYSDILEFTSSKYGVSHIKGWAYDRMAGFVIRPVLADGGSVIPIDTPTIDPGTDPDKPDDPDEPVTGGDVKLGETVLTETAKDSKIFEATVDMAASSEFAISISGVDYGFASYSGAGGLGKITSANSSLPCYNFASAKTAKSELYYTVSRAIGTMEMVSAGGNKFTTALDAAAKVLVRVDMNGSKPLYYFEIVKSDASVVFHEDFDLCTYGGDYMVAIPGTKDSAMDGVTPGSKGSTTANNPSFTFDYPTAGTASGGVATAAYLAHRGFDGWEFEYCGERPGALQMCSGSAPGHLITPKMSKLTAATDVTLTIDLARFSTTSVDPINVEILGGGQIVSAKAEIEAYAAAGTAAASKVFEITPGTSYSILDDAMCPHTLGNADADKPHSVFTFGVQGLTPDSRIKIDCKKGASNAPRCFIFDIKVTK